MSHQLSNSSQATSQANLIVILGDKSQNPWGGVLLTWFLKILAGECRCQRQRKWCWWGSSGSGDHAANTGPWPGWAALPQAPLGPWGSAVGRAERGDRLEMLWLPTPPNPIPPTGGSTSCPRGDPGKWQELGRPGSEKEGHNQTVWASKAGPQGWELLF